MIDGWSKSLVFPFVALLVESKLAGSIFLFSNLSLAFVPFMCPCAELT